ncbi:hypothetical protein [Pelagibius sp. Alg239-R121]|uniref:hypothetical protein n=1 Tax=Pelagibius sp. Alg239-R121 TaxID=2993448 RepID=UPI0024A767AC|nr:hypothetical protein [Pelagibius sp. Alg239-R121]
MLSALMNQASDLLQQTRDRLHANSLGLPASSDSASEAKNPAGAVPALEKSDGEGGSFDRFDRDATTLRLSARARLQAYGQEKGASGASENNDAKGLGLDNLGQAVSGAIQELRNELEKAFTALGLDASKAASAANAARDAVTGATQRESFQLELSQITAQETRAQQSDGDFYYGASLVAEQLEVSYDAETGVFQASVVRVSISVEVGTGDFVNDVGAGTLLNSDGGQIDLDQLLGGSFFNGLQLAAGEQERAVVQPAAKETDDDDVDAVTRLKSPDDIEETSDDDGEAGSLVLISSPTDEQPTEASTAVQRFRLDILVRISQPAAEAQQAPAQQTSVNQLTNEPTAVPFELLEPVDISV